MIPEKLGRFEVVEEIGRGAMGVVYKGTDPKIQRTVALKVVNLDQGDINEMQKQARERFLLEGQATGQLSHPNILTVYDIGEEGHNAFMAMEYLEGDTLRKMIDTNSLKDIDHILSLVRQIADGLHHAHEKRIVHRDIKPSNIMVIDGITPKITDFGLAHLQDSNLTTSGTVLGTPSYMSPEQVRGQKVDGRSDLFSLGIMLYEMLTGEKPFGGENITSVIFRVVNEEPAPPRDLRPDLPETVDAFMRKALAKNPDERFQTAREFADALGTLKIKKNGSTIFGAARTQVLSAGSVGQGHKKKSNLPYIVGAVTIIAALMYVGTLLFAGGETGETATAPPSAVKPDNNGNVELHVTEVMAEKPVATNESAPALAAITTEEQKEEVKEEPPSEQKTVGVSLLSVTSTPPEAEVYINDKKMGTTPYLNRRYKEKTFTLAIAKEGYEKHKETFTHDRDRTFHIALKKIPPQKDRPKEQGEEVSILTQVFNPVVAGNVGTLVVEAKPGDRVSIDGRNYTKFPVRLKEAYVGNHNIFVVRKGEKPFLKTVWLKRGETLKVTPFSD